MNFFVKWLVKYFLGRAISQNTLKEGDITKYFLGGAMSRNALKAAEYHKILFRRGNITKYFKGGTISQNTLKAARYHSDLYPPPTWSRYTPEHWFVDARFTLHLSLEKPDDFRIWLNDQDDDTLSWAFFLQLDPDMKKCLTSSLMYQCL